MDALAQTLMKGAVNCDKHSDLQNSVNQLVVECGIRFWAFPESISQPNYNSIKNNDDDDDGNKLLQQPASLCVVVHCCHEGSQKRTKQ